MSGVPSWDLKEDDPSYRRPKPTNLKLRFRASLMRKVEIIEQYAKDPATAPADLRRTRTALRKWFDPERGLWKWKDSKVDDPRGHNCDLVARFFAAIQLVNVHKAGSSKAEMKRVKERIDAEEVKRQRDALLLQNAALLDKLLNGGKYGPHSL